MKKNKWLIVIGVLIVFVLILCIFAPRIWAMLVNSESSYFSAEKIVEDYIESDLNTSQTITTYVSENYRLIATVPVYHYAVHLVYFEDTNYIYFLGTYMKEKNGVSVYKINASAWEEVISSDTEPEHYVFEPLGADKRTFGVECAFAVGEYNEALCPGFEHFSFVINGETCTFYYLDTFLQEHPESV